MSGFNSGFDELQSGNNSVDRGGVSYHIQSKDKRNQLHGADIKQFIIEDNVRRNTSLQKK